MSQYPVMNQAEEVPVYSRHDRRAGRRKAGHGLDSALRMFFASDPAHLYWDAMGVGHLSVSGGPLVRIRVSGDSVLMTVEEDGSILELNRWNYAGADELGQAILYAYDRCSLGAPDTTDEEMREFRLKALEQKASNPYLRDHHAVNMIYGDSKASSPRRIKVGDNEPVLKALADNYSLGPETLDLISRIRFPKVGKRQAECHTHFVLAGNPNLDVETLDRLCRHRIKAIRLKAEHRLQERSMYPPRRRLRDLLFA